MKTGRLLKFRRGGVEIHAYVYRDGRVMRATLYRTGPGSRTGGQPDHELQGVSEADVEAAVHAWVEEHLPAR
jgi:hypothetical protein